MITNKTIWISLILFSCVDKESLTIQEMKLLPYFEGDTLVYQSSEGLRDTIFITKRQIRNYNPGDLSSRWLYRPLEGSIKYYTSNSRDEKNLILVYKRDDKLSYNGYWPNFYGWIDNTDFSPSLESFVKNNKSEAQIFESKKVSVENNVKRIYLRLNGVYKYITVDDIEWIRIN